MTTTDEWTGQAVIVNECDKPCGWLVAIVVAVADDGETLRCQYLNADPSLDRYGTLSVRADRVRTLAAFGVQLLHVKNVARLDVLKQWKGDA